MTNPKIVINFEKLNDANDWIKVLKIFIKEGPTHKVRPYILSYYSLVNII